MNHSSRATALAVAVAALAICPSSQAALTIDLRFTDGTKTKAFNAGDLSPMTINAWAVVTGTAGNNQPEGLQSAVFAVRSRVITGGISGGITSASLRTGWSGSGSNLGSASNISVDGIGDWGNANNTPLSITGTSFLRIRTNKSANNATDWGDSDSPAGSTYNSLANGGNEFLVASFIFTPNSLPTGSSIAFDPVCPLGGTVTPAGWFEDTADKLSGSPTGAKSPTTGTFGPVTPNSTGSGGVLIGIPEPASVSLIGILSLGLLGRNRART